MVVRADEEREKKRWGEIMKRPRYVSSFHERKHGFERP